LEEELQERERELSERSRTDRNVEREIKSLQHEVAQKDKARVRMEEDLQRSNEKNVKLRQMIDEMISENAAQGKLSRFGSVRGGM